MKEQISLPVAVIIAGLIIAGAVLYSNTNEIKNVAQVAGTEQQKVQPQTGSTDKVRPVSADDHIRGDINAPVKIVVYSDFECPFCQRFHNTMNQVMNEYGKDKKVAFIFRQFPLDQLHPVKARKEALATECAAELAGNEGFWKFTDKMFELTQTNNKTDVDKVLPQIAKEIGLNEQKFNECVSSGKFNSKIDADIANGTETGGRGTPWSIVIGPDGKTYELSGAQPFESVKQVIDNLLKK